MLLPGKQIALHSDDSISAAFGVAKGVIICRSGVGQFGSTSGTSAPPAFGEALRKLIYLSEQLIDHSSLYDNC